MNKRKVIFVGGVRYSGTTLFDMMLASTNKGLSCGELDKLFLYPKIWLPKECGCGKKNCSFWKEIIAGNASDLYRKIFEQYPKLAYIVDSSKNPAWIAYQSKQLVKQNIDSYHLLIWKTPNESAHSFSKRNHLDIWQRSWIVYHLLYFSLVNNFKTVKFRDLLDDRQYLKTICEYVGINFSESMYSYWDQEHHTVGGNASAKIHLYKVGGKVHNKFKKAIIERAGGENKTIENRQTTIYQERTSDIVKGYVEDKYKKNDLIKKVESNLGRMDAGCQNEKENNKLTVNPINKMAFLIRYKALISIRNLKNKVNMI